MLHAELVRADPGHLSGTELSHAVTVLGEGGSIGLQRAFDPAVFSLGTCAYKSLAAEPCRTVDGIKRIPYVPVLQGHVVTGIACGTGPREMIEHIVFPAGIVRKTCKIIQRAILKLHEGSYRYPVNSLRTLVAENEYFDSVIYEFSYQGESDGACRAGKNCSSHIYTPA